MKIVLPLLALLFCTHSQAQTNTYPAWYARTTGKLPALAYGLGEDRLGGAKMGYIDSNVLLQVIDTARGMYKVKLSAQHTAYIEKPYLRADTATRMKAAYTTGSFSAKGDSLYDYVGISMEEKLPYKTWMEINPSRIVVDVYGVQSNTNWITQLSSLKEVKNLYYNQVEDDVLRVTIELQHRQHWGYSISYINKSLVLKINRQPEKLDLRNLHIAIDAGHGGTNTGASGTVTKASEKVLTLQFAKALEHYLQKRGVKNITMTRNNDTSFDNKDRILWLQQLRPHILISLHLNSSGNAQVKGTSTYYKHIGFRPLTTAILRKMLDLKLNEFGNVGSFNFALNSPTEFPNSLVEIAFLSNAEDEARIVNPKFHNDVAKKIYLGITEWLKSVR